MAGRYIITGTNLGILIGYVHAHKTMKLLKELHRIEEENFVGNSDNPIEEDIESLEKFFMTVVKKDAN